MISIPLQIVTGCVSFDYAGHPTKESGSNDTSIEINDSADSGHSNAAPSITNVAATPNSIFNYGTESFIVTATITDDVGVTNASLTIDSIIQVLTDDDGDSIYQSPSYLGSLFAPGLYALQVTASDGILAATDSSASVEIKEPDTCPYICSSNICLYIDGTLEAEMNTAYPTQMNAINVIRLGYGGQYVDNLSLVVDGTTVVSEDFSTTRGCFTTGSVASGVYVSEGTDNDCFFSPTVDATTAQWMVSIDVLAGSTPNFALRSTEYSSPGVNWDFAAGGYINDGNFNNVTFGTPDTSQNHTVMMCNKNSE